MADIQKTEKTITNANATQQFVDVKEIKNGVVILKDNSLRAVVMVSGVNFDLKSQDEQDIITSAYQSFLNGLDFSLQTIVHSRKLNIDRYLERMQGIFEKEPSQLLRTQISEYIEFIRGLVKDNEIMTKTFFIVVPYEGLGMQNVKKGLTSFFGKKKDAGEHETFEQQVIQLQQRVDQVVAGMSQAGLRAVVLNDEELTELYYNLYNPEAVEKKLQQQPLETSTQ